MRFQFLIGRLVTAKQPGRAGGLFWFQFLIGRLVTRDIIRDVQTVLDSNPKRVNNSFPVA